MSNSIGEPSATVVIGWCSTQLPCSMLVCVGGTKTSPVRTLCIRTTFRGQTTSCKYVARSSSLHDALLLKARNRLTTHALHGSFYTFRHALFGRLFQRLSVQHVVCHFHTSLQSTRQHARAIGFKERKQQTKETAQYTAKTVSSLKSTTDGNRHLSTILAYKFRLASQQYDTIRYDRRD